MAILEPVATWIKGINAKDNEILTTYDFGVVKTDESSPEETFFFWNNYGGVEDAPVMEDLTITTRDLTGGDGSSVGNIVEAVRDNWIQVKIESLSESSFVPIGKGGVGTTNPSGKRSMGTTGQTKNINADTAIAWTASQTWSLNQYIKPTVSNGFIYKVTQAGLGGGVEPSWLTTEGLIVNDGTAILTAVPIMKAPASHQLLGLANNAQNDGTGVNDAKGNFVQLKIKASVPASATSGRNEGNVVADYRFV